MKVFLTLLLCVTLAIGAAFQAEAATSKKRISKNSTAATPKKKKPATPKPKPKAAPASQATPAPATPAPATPAPIAPATPKPRTAPAAVVASSELLGFADQPARVQRLIEGALALTPRNLTYTYGSADPDKGGMDCSGAIYYLLREQGFREVPRDSGGQYSWARKEAQFFAVVSKKEGGFEFADLLPGDLLFWSGTYGIARDPPVTHTMLYLGIHRKRGQHLMWGSSDGRTYDGKPRNGVSVFDFKMPRVERGTGEAAKADFLGYARIPGLRE